ncbi:MAG: SIMPL domain-containing protein [Dehalococcoidia bacterium]
MGHALAADPTVPSVTVRGQGSLTAPPDTAVVRLGVSVQAAKVADARSQAATAAAAVIAAAKNDGVLDKDIQTVQFNIGPVYDNKNGSQSLLGYRVDNVLQLKIRNLDSSGQVIDDATAAGGDATVVQGISFTIDDTTALAHQARILSIQDALAQATDFATAAGATVGKVISISEVTAAPPVPFDAAPVAAAASQARTPVQAGTLRVDVSVTVTYALQ